MTKLQLTRHAGTRIRQRGLSQNDLSLIVEFGTEIERGYMLRRKDVAAIERDMKRMVSRLHRLAGKFVCLDGETVITAFHATTRQQRHLLRQH